MRTRNPQATDKDAIVYARRSHGHAGLSFLTTLAFLLSLLSLGISGFLAYRFLDVQQAVSVVTDALNQNAAQKPNAETSQTTNQPSTNPTASQTTESPQPSAQAPTNSFSQPGTTQPAIDNKAQVEIIAVNRIQNPNTKLRDFVNIQFRVRRVAPKTDAIGYEQGVIYPGSTTARNPTTGEPYQAVDRINRATSNISVSDLNQNATADAYVWMQIPESTKGIDILIPKTQAFKNVTIAN
ncbi:MAG: hypothetical protein KME45_05705 [Stenomitos rutilans HA7619-LM2]|jgi:cytoskeletal protein RodZ|nr:hypothetical protein [Stenomitos rutilans HA7619-LM2]